MRTSISLGVFLVFVFVNAIVFSQPQNQTDTLGRKTGKWSFSVVDSIDIDARLYTFCNYKKGILVGDFRGYLGEKLLYKVFYVDGRKDGIEKFYYRNNGLKNLNVYNLDSLIYSISFYESGSVYQEIDFQNGLMNGQFVEYYKNGRVFIKRTYIEGKLNGHEIYYKRNGKIDNIFEYDDDVFIKKII